MNFQSPTLDPIILKGGMDQITPTLTLSNGALRHSLNFEAAVTGGYSRIAGYERYDGQPSPTDSSLNEILTLITFVAYDNTPEVGTVATSSGGATATIAYVSGLMIAVAKSTGTWGVGESVTVGSYSIGTTDSVTATPSTPQQNAIVRKAISDIYRADITTVPGTGPIRGVVEFNDITYAFRDSGANVAIYKSSTAGWVNVPLYKSVSFTAGGTAVPSDGSTLTKGGVTAVIKRVVLTGGVWSSGTAVGRLIIADPTGGNFSAGAATIGATGVTLSGVETAIAMLAGGKFEFDEHNFYGQASSNRLYGCDGVNAAFEFDGDILVPILTGTAVDTPSHIAAHTGYLFLGIAASAIYSVPGQPYNYTGASGAGEIATGSNITGMLVMPGATTTAALCITGRVNTGILYGTSPTDFNFVTYNTGTGSIPFSLQNMAQTFAFDDRGVNSIQTSLQYGNFVQSALSNQILPFINLHSDLLTASTLCRRKSQYRAFFSDGFGVFITVASNKLMGCMPVWFPNDVTCCYEGKKSDGTDVIYFGSSDGMIYQMEKGTSFDGKSIDFNFTTNFSNAKSPRTLKRYRKIVPEIFAQLGTYVAFQLSYLLGYDSTEYNQDSDDSYSQYNGQAKWDDFTWDNYNWDEELSSPMECYCDGTAENIAIQLSGSLDYVPAFTLNSFLVHYSPRRMMR